MMVSNVSEGKTSVVGGFRARQEFPQPCVIAVVHARCRGTAPHTRAAPGLGAAPASSFNRHATNENLSLAAVLVLLTAIMPSVFVIIAMLVTIIIVITRLDNSACARRHDQRQHGAGLCNTNKVFHVRLPLG
jgi:hypothetical protein